MDKADIVVVGGGIVGLATAHQLLKQQPNLQVTVVEKEDTVAGHQTGHNSGVLHSGIYYKPGSRKALLATSGRAAMVEFCEQHGIPHDVCGKVIVAINDIDLPRLDALEERAQANGVPARRITAGELNELEPHAAGIAGLHVPVTGITDYGEVCQVMQKQIGELGGTVRTGTEVTTIKEGSTVRVATTKGDIEASLVVTCGGLHSDRLALQTAPQTTERIMPFRGEYFELAPDRRHLVNNLIYPVPDPDFPFLGVHLTRMIDGSVHAGPNAVLALAREGYTWGDVDLKDLSEVLRNPGWWRLARNYWKTGMGEYYRSLSKRGFVKALQRLVPAVQVEDLVPSPAGVRAQAVSREGSLLDDFVWSETDRVVNVLNAPSPAATAALSIGDAIVDRLLTHQF
ncbi:MAG: L-2-hydroxyglutarate oxidase [Acidimicrobiia bacterium]|nr:L-2-hydroxyglutarate oxidase [Acidimicrobiia bacterium]